MGRRQMWTSAGHEMKMAGPLLRRAFGETDPPYIHWQMSASSNRGKSASVMRPE